MAYDVGSDPYLDPDTGILRNLLGIATQDELDKAEADVSYIVLIGLPDSTIPGNFDLLHLQAVHKALFGSLYDWAGELRTVELSKGNTRFAHAPYMGLPRLWLSPGCGHEVTYEAAPGLPDYARVR